MGNSVQPADIGWPTGNGNKLSNRQACCQAQLCLSAAYFLSLSCGQSCGRTWLFALIFNSHFAFLFSSILLYLHPLAAQYPRRSPHEHRGGRAHLLEALDGGAAQVQAHSRLGDAHRQRVVVATDLKDGKWANVQGF